MLKRLEELESRIQEMPGGDERVKKESLAYQIRFKLCELDGQKNKNRVMKQIEDLFSKIEL